LLSVVSSPRLTSHETHNLAPKAGEWFPLVLSLILAESAIELVPNELVNHPAILKSAQRKKRDPHRLILDQSYHHSAILDLGPSSARRGRPDITHFSLLLALGSPLNHDGNLRCYVHTRDENIIEVDSKARLPRNTDRFTSLLEQLYQEKTVPPTGPPLLSIRPGSLGHLVDEIAGISIALTTKGLSKRMDEVAFRLGKLHNPILLIGGFPRGHFSRETLSRAKESYKIHNQGLEAWTVVARAIYDYERAIESTAPLSQN
jgi:rRNA small subunit pseudouridine methyltransferase Nep1